MAFVKIDKAMRASAIDDMPVVTMGAYLADGKAHKGKSITFRITRALISQLGWEIVGDKLRIGVFEGTDKDVGFLQLMPDQHGYVASCEAETKQGASISVTYDRFKHYVLNESPVPSHNVNHIVNGNALVVECPDWLRFNPQSVPKPEPEPVHHLNRQQRRIAAARIASSLKR